MNQLHRMMCTEICKYFNCGYNEIFSRRRQKNLVNAKKVIYWILRREGLTYNQIARLVNKDHETVIVGIRSLPDEYKKYALSMFSKYKKYGLRESKELEQQTFNDRMNKITELLNKGLTEQEVADRLGESLTSVSTDISLHIGKKKIPDYSYGSAGFKIIHFFSQKNKKNY